MDFVAIDVETANPNMASICQVGIAVFVGGELANERSVIVDPEDYFDPMNVSIHGIKPHAVRGQPRLPDIERDLRSMLAGTVCVCHSHFDRVALERAFLKYNLSPIEAHWLDTAKVARRTWPQVAWTGYGLANCCRLIGYQFRHHDALEDAKAAGRILLAAIQETGLDLEAWFRRVEEPIEARPHGSSRDVRRNGNPEGDLFGERIVFTGSLSMPRGLAADLAAQAGCRVDANVSKKTTIVVVGGQGISTPADHSKSTKHRKAEALNADGCRIRIIGESDFAALLRLSS